MTRSGSSPPGPRVAADLAAAAVGSRPRDVRHFTNGACHYVYEVTFPDHPPVVVRIAGEQRRHTVADAVSLSRLLRAEGVPLPAILAEDASGPYPHLVLERFPGTDLGDVMSGLPVSALNDIALAVAHAQAATSSLPSAGRYGYAARPHEAPYSSWSHVVAANLSRSRARIAAAGLFEASLARKLAEKIEDARQELDLVPPTPFLHDTTRKNVIVTPGGAFSGIVDVDDLCFGDPRYPVALTLAATLAFGGPISYADCWMRHARFTDDRIFRLYVVLFLIEFMGEHGLADYTKAIDFTENERNSLLLLAADAMRVLESLER